jgi:YqjK-like protein
MPELVEIGFRKQQLIARCAVQRATIVDTFRDLERPIAIVDRAVSVVRFFRAHPLLLGVAVAAIVAMKRRGSAVGLAARGAAAWRLWRAVAPWAHRFGVDFPRRRRREKAGHVAD